MDILTLTFLAIFITFLYMVWNNADNKGTLLSSQPQQQNVEQLLLQIQQLTEHVKRLQLQNQQLLRPQQQQSQGTQPEQQIHQQPTEHQPEQYLIADKQSQCPTYESIFPQGAEQNFANVENQTKAETDLHAPTAPPLLDVPDAVLGQEFDNLEKIPEPKLTRTRSEEEILRLVEAFENSEKIATIKQIPDHRFENGKGAMKNENGLILKPDMKNEDFWILEDWLLDRSKIEKDSEIAIPIPEPKPVQRNRYAANFGRPIGPVEDLFLNPNHEKAKPLNRQVALPNKFEREGTVKDISDSPAAAASTKYNDHRFAKSTIIGLCTKAGSMYHHFYKGKLLREILFLNSTPDLYVEGRDKIRIEVPYQYHFEKSEKEKSRSKFEKLWLKSGGLPFDILFPNLAEAKKPTDNSSSISSYRTSFDKSSNKKLKSTSMKRYSKS